MHDINMYVFADPKRKILITGSVPTENLPLKSDEVPKVIIIIIIYNYFDTVTSQPHPN